MSKICYLCGREMSEGTDCCPHDEHIIPNAIGGHLVCNSILCKKCGGVYSKSDRNFVDIFGCFVHNLEHLMLFDRKHDGALVKGSYYDGDKTIPINVNKKGATPQEKIINEKEADRVIITANKKVASQLRKKYEKEGKKVETVENLFGPLALNFSEGNARFNDQFKEGFVKMAVEYALYKGVERKQLDVALTINNDNGASVNYDTIPVFPFVPMDKYNIVFENNRFDLEKHYPSHTMMLFNEGRRLFCYIDLFSTFQYYVLLGENYMGKPICSCYYQPLFVQREPYKYNREDLEDMKIYDLHIVASELGITYKNKSLKKICDEIVEVSSKTIVKRSYDDLTKALPNYTSVVSVYEEECFHDDDIEGVRQEIKDEIRENSKPDSYRQILSRIVDGKMQQFSYLTQCNSLAIEDIDMVREYTNMKFRQLEDYSNRLHFEKQINEYLKIVRHETF